VNDKDGIVDEPLLEVQDLRTSFFTDAGEVKAVDGVDFTIHANETLGMVGESGCGKSVTSLSMMRLIDTPGKIVGGSIRFHGQELLTKSVAEMQKIRGNDISMIFQEPMTSLNPVHTIGAQIVEALMLHQNLTRHDALLKAVDMLKLVGIPAPDQRVHEYPHELSGGMRQRVMIAMALSCNPKLLIADEPTTALDVTIQAQILDLMKKLKNTIGSAVLLITHDLGVVAELADNVVVLYAGQVVEYADVKTLFDHPKHPYTIALLESIPRLTDDRGRKLFPITGSIPDPLHLPGGCPFHPRCRFAQDVCAVEHPPLKVLDDGSKVRCWMHVESHAKYFADVDRTSPRLVSDSDDRRPAAIVAHQSHLRGAGESGGESTQERIIGSGEGIDRLRAVAHDAHTITLTEPQSQQSILDRTDILEFIDGEVPIGAAHLVGDIGPIIEDRDSEQQHVIEVDDTLLGFDVLITHEDPRDISGIECGVAAVSRRERDISIGKGVGLLGPGDLADQFAHHRRIARHLRARGGLTHQWRDAPGDLRDVPTDRARPEVAQLSQCRGMEGPGLHALHTQGGQPVAHLAGSSVGEGDREGAPGRTSSVRGIGDAVGDRRGLARPCPGPHHDRPLDRERDGTLLVVEGVEDRIGHAPHRVRSARHPRPASGPRWRACCYSSTIEPVTDATPHLPEHPAVTMFTTSWCGFCFRLKAQMDRAGIAVREVDIEADDEAAAFVGSVNDGNHTVPTLLFTDGSTLTNPSIGAVERHLAEIGQV